MGGSLLPAKPPRFSAIANPRGAPRAADPIADVVARAQQIERDGFDYVALADWVMADPFPPLMEVARATERIGLMTRVVGAFSRSPVLIASSTAWVDRAAGGRFTLGLGASLPNETADFLGITFDRPAVRMAATLRIIRALFGEDMPGVARLPDGSIQYGGIIALNGATTDIVPAHRPPIWIAAAGPKMLEVAGALADGVMLELTTPAYLRWAWEHIRAGAAKAGRSLDGFEMCVQGSFVLTDVPEWPERATGGMAFAISHCVSPEFEQLWFAEGIGPQAMAVRDAALRGDRREAMRLVQTEIWPRHAIYASRPESLWRFIDGHRAAGATILALPASLHDLMGITLADVRRHVETTPLLVELP